MTHEAAESDASTEERLVQARDVYARTFRALQASLDILESGGDSTGETRNRTELFRLHLKQLQSVFEIEGSLDTHGQKAGAGRIDLDAARAEIRVRLARIRERGGS